MPRLDPGSTAGFHHAIRRIRLSEFWARAAGCRRPQRTDRAPAGTFRHRRLSHRRHHHRPVWACGIWHAREHHSGFRTGCRDVAVPALGAFLAGVLLAESNYRHELAADIEPFRGLLLALFFMGIGMSIDLTIVRA